MPINYELIKILRGTKAQDTQLANTCLLSFDARDTAGIQFNCNFYYAVLKLLNETLVTYHKNEQDNIITNKELLKFTYLGQIHLTRLAFNATIHPEHIEYSCFELGVFYLTLLNLAKAKQFHDFAKALLQLQNRLFQSKNQLTLIAPSLTSFQSWYLDEINLYQQQFALHLHDTHASNKTFITIIEPNNKTLHACSIIETYKNPKYDFYQKQLALKLIEYLYLDSIFVEYATRAVITKLVDFMNGYLSEVEKQKKLDSSCNEYKNILLNELKKRLPTTSDSSNEKIVDLSHCDYSNLILDLTSFTNVTFVNEIHTKLPNQFRFCIFKNIKFTEQMFENTSFDQCIFINCFLRDLTISCRFNDCTFEQCKFINVNIEYADFSRSTMRECSLVNVHFYRVTASFMRFIRTIFSNSAINFSDLKSTTFSKNNFSNVSFAGTHIKQISFIECIVDVNNNTASTIMQEALLLNAIGDNEYLLAQVSAMIAQQLPGAASHRSLITTTQDLGNQLSKFTQSEFLNNSAIDPTIRFKKLLGWILCAIDRLKEYCNDFEKNSDVRSFDNFAVFEIVADNVKDATRCLNRFINLYDRCHLSLMQKVVLKNGLFKNFQQYQQLTHFNPALYPQVEKRHLKESLFAIHELHQSIQYIDKIFRLIQLKIEENDRLLSRTQPKRETKSLRYT